MNPRANKRHAAAKNGVPSTAKKRLPAYKRQPDLYYSHVWLDREIYAQVLAFIGWERQKKYSVKMAVRILLELGLKYYIVDQMDCTPMTGQVGLGESGGVCRYSLD